MRTLLLAFALFIATWQPASSAILIERIAVDSGPPVLLLKGEFEFSDDPALLEREAKAAHAGIVTFESNGGNVVAAMAFGRTIRALGVNTIQLRSHQCASACTLAFLGGVIRSAEPGAIGVHRASFSQDIIDGHVAVAAVQAMTAQIMTYMIEMGVDPRLLQLSLSVASDDMRYLTASEMAEYKVTTSNAPASTPQPAASSVPSMPAASRETSVQTEPPTNEKRAEDFLLAYHDAWSQPNTTALRFMETAYAEGVLFYGKTFSHAGIMDEKRTFAERWPMRAYVLRHNGLEIVCNLACNVSGIVDWFAHSPNRARMSSGSAQFQVVWNPSTGKIMSETGAVLSSDKHAREPSRVIALWQEENGLCRGGPSDSDKTMDACDRRDAIAAKLQNIGWCFGQPGEYGYQMNWHPCDEHGQNPTTEVVAVQKAQDLDSPAFRVSDVYKGKVRLPDFRKRDRAFNSFRTRIRDGMRAGPNYAGRYSVIQFGCGTGCSMVIVGDNKTGQPKDFPLGGEANMYLTLRFNLKSRLMTAQWADLDADRCYVEFLDFDGTAWKQLERQTVGSQDACYKEIAENLE